jgi:hypothetical protein
MEKHTASRVKNRQTMQTTSTVGHDSPDTKPRHEMIAEAAYYLAEKRGFVPGQELEDWRDAESRIDQYTTGGGVAH